MQPSGLFHCRANEGTSSRLPAGTATQAWKARRVARALSDPPAFCPGCSGALSTAAPQLLHSPPLTLSKTIKTPAPWDGLRPAKTTTMMTGVSLATGRMANGPRLSQPPVPGLLDALTPLTLRDFCPGLRWRPSETSQSSLFPSGVWTSKQFSDRG